MTKPSPDAKEVVNAAKSVIADNQVDAFANALMKCVQRQAEQ